MNPEIKVFIDLQLKRMSIELEKIRKEPSIEKLIKAKAGQIYYEDIILQELKLKKYSTLTPIEKEEAINYYKIEFETNFLRNIN